MWCLQLSKMSLHLLCRWNEACVPLAEHKRSSFLVEPVAEHKTVFIFG